jgi:hypothetical protein
VHWFVRCSNCRPDETQDNSVSTHLSRMVVYCRHFLCSGRMKGPKHSEDTNTWPDRNYVSCGRVYIYQQSASRYWHSAVPARGSLSREMILGIILSFIYRPIFDCPSHSWTKVQVRSACLIKHHAMKTLEEWRYISTNNLCTRWMWAVRFTLWLFYHLGWITLYQ